MQTSQYRRFSKQVKAGSRKKFAFWKYDLFPFILGGEVSKTLEGGQVEIVGFGPGYNFKPFLITSYADGVTLHEKLEQIKKNYEQARVTLEIGAKQEVVHAFESIAIKLSEKHESYRK